MLGYKVTAATKPEHCQESQVVNDCHSGLNPTLVSRSVQAESLLKLQSEIKKAKRNGEKICIAGGKHSMGGQQFKSGGVLIDTSKLNSKISFDQEKGLIELEAGMQWPELIDLLKREQKELDAPWSIIQKQTGCDRLSLGGALASNVHGRGLKLSPIVSNIDSFKLINADGDIVSCSRNENSDLFCRAIGGYGLFGMISSVTLRLARSSFLERRVEMAESKDAVALLERAAAAGAKYGDFQFAIDHKSPDFLKLGVLSTYTPIQKPQKSGQSKKLLAEEDWKELLFLAHTKKSAAFAKYAEHYLKTNGQVYDTSDFQLATYIDGYHQEIDRRLGGSCTGSEMISELYVPREKLGVFLARSAEFLRENGANVIYGTVRLIERDEETFLPWARNSWACTVFNLHVEHSPHGVAAAAANFRGLIDIALSLGGSFFLTYHRFASRAQVHAAYPEMPDFLQEKLRYDPGEFFCSDWYEHLKGLFAATHALY